MEPVVIILIAVISIVAFLLIVLGMKALSGRNGSENNNVSGRRKSGRKRAEHTRRREPEKPGQRLAKQESRILQTEEAVSSGQSELPVPETDADKDKEPTGGNKSMNRKQSRQHAGGQQTEEPVPVAQVRKRRIPVQDENKEGRESPAFIFPDFSINDSDPFAGDKSINSQLDALLADPYSQAESAEGRAGDRIRDGEHDACTDVPHLADEPDETAGEMGVAEWLYETAKESHLAGEETDLEKEQAEGQASESSVLAEEPAEEPVAGPDNVEFHNLQFRKRENAAYSVDRIPQEYTVDYEGETAKLVVYGEAVKQPQTGRNGMTVLYNSHVYDGNRPKIWDEISEVRIRRGETVSVDFGVGVLLPEGYALQLVESPELLTKFGLQMAGEKVIGRNEASQAVMAEFVACSDVSYIAKNQSLLSCKVVRVA